MFKEVIISDIDNLDEEINGILIHGENFQALNLLQNKYIKKIDCIYIDPPYNTNATPIVYKNGYRDSSWLSLMHDRLIYSSYLLKSDNGYYSVAIDDVELHYLYQLIECDLLYYDLFKVIVEHYPGSGTGRSNVSKTHEYNIFAIPHDKDILRGELKPARDRLRGFCRSGTGDNNYRRGRPNSFYAVLVNPNTLEIKGFEPPPQLNSNYPVNQTDNGLVRVYPLGADGSERCWSLSYDSAKKYNDKGMLKCSPNLVIQRLYYDEEDRALLPSIWADTKFNAVVNGTNLLTALFNNSELFSFPKSLYTVLTAIEAGTFNKENAVILDYFAGSGTTGHAVINLNRENKENYEGNRKYILVEMGDYFNSVTKPRMQKVVYSKDWKEGKPTSRNTGVSHIMKYFNLESYEDTLTNIEFSDTPDGKSLAFGEDYLIKYMLDVETKDSLLKIEEFEDPFNYSLKITEKNELKESNIDIIETFNYLIGLNVVKNYALCFYNVSKTIDKFHEYVIDLIEDKNGYFKFKQLEGTLNDGSRILVIWRNINDNIIESNAALDAYFQKYRKNAENMNYDTIYVNGDNNLENIKPTDQKWNVKIIEKEFLDRMFED